MAICKPTIYALLAVTGSVAVAWAIAADNHAPPMTAEQRSAIRAGMSPDQLAVVMGSQPAEIRTINGSEYRIWHWPGNALQALFVNDILTSASTHSILTSDIPAPGGRIALQADRVLVDDVLWYGATAFELGESGELVNVDVPRGYGIHAPDDRGAL